ncbi:MAG: hypothetical protein J7576_17220 [Siphonobacter aquaeclarae]|nr:hypothetical protein [Siphonobacter aquaeclarae]
MPKLDVTAVENYAKAYASQLCRQYFSEKNRINGDDLLRLSSVPQVNLFVLRDLYEAWKETASAFRSPYFDFEQEEVKTSLQTFLNTVSKYISVQRKDLEPLLTKATHETLELLLQPESYFDGWLREQPDFRLTSAALKHFQKYNRIHKSIVAGLSARLAGRDAVYINEVLALVPGLLAQADAPQETLSAFSATLPLEESSLYQGNFFDQIVPEPVAEQVSATPTPEPVVPAPAPPVAAQPVIPQAVPEPVVIAPAKQPAREESTAVHQQYASTGATLNDSLRKEKPAAESLASQLRPKNGESIHSFISLNRKFIFINQLFQGDATAYHHAVDELEKCQAFDQAKDLMNRTYSTKYNWRNVVDEADDFYEIVRRRFNG